MRIHVIPSPYYAANSLVLVPGGGSQALVVDPSAGVRDELRSVLDEAGARAAAVLATHGHPDHVWDCAEVASWGGDGRDAPPAPVYVPGPDLYRMDDPLAGVPMEPPIELGPWRKPEDLRAFPAGSVEIVEGVWLKMIPAPGHSEGSAVFIGHCDIEVRVGRETFVRADTPVPWAMPGDVIFAGSVGRTDLPGGDETQMRHSLRTISNALDPRTILIPGHGPATRLSDEITTNPYLIRARTLG
ncbi:MBL fold metallo-hydrolase [Actinomyces sp. B33]|uniref:MBL fold metallo-hydrolase n=1 Tax=Actinomyces sp. B33 TaxID=2942131 RepID=UPI002341A104|nr:MBL fold metallo-hydrolase [Actinomyces sp. B33]MDC4233232.1 MBL fold metallo-hydrolase [Actinomyces sp. B33]